MVLSRDAKNVTLSSTVYPRVKARWEQDLDTRPSQTNKTFTGYINDILISVLEKDEFLETKIPGFDLIGHNSKQLFIKDIKKGKIAEIVVKTSKLYCALCKSNDCEHVQYALLRPEITKLKSDTVMLF